MSAYAIEHKVEMNVEDCCNCGMPFAMPAQYQDRMRRDGTTFYCPSGHPQSYTESEVDRLRKKLSEQTRVATEAIAAKQRAEQERANAQEALVRAGKEAVRLKKRINAGVCTCCNRTFQNLARHMATKHKDEAKNA